MRCQRPERPGARPERDAETHVRYRRCRTTVRPDDVLPTTRTTNRPRGNPRRSTRARSRRPRNVLTRRPWTYTRADANPRPNRITNDRRLAHRRGNTAPPDEAAANGSVPQRKKYGSSSSGAGTVAEPGPSNRRPDSTARQQPFGKYTLRETAPATTTGATSTSGPSSHSWSCRAAI